MKDSSSCFFTLSHFTNFFNHAIILSMKIHPVELKAYDLYLKDHPHLPRLTLEQISLVQDSGKSTKPHQLLNFILIVSLFGLDILSSTIFPTHYPEHFYLFAFMHGYLIYSLSAFLLNEGAAHQLLFPGAENLSRLYFADPIYFAENHRRHHEFFATKDDGVFTSLVNPKRFFISLVPLASAFKFCDYKIHTGETWTKSKIVSEILGRVFFIAQFIYLKHFVGGAKALLFIFIALWFAFILDRLRETIEHNLMGNSNEQGARDLGLGFWGLLIGGGPWGLPCRLIHHLVPDAPWYQQIILHFRLKKILTKEQKDFFLLKPLIGFPLLLIKIIRMNSIYIKKAKQVV